MQYNCSRQPGRGIHTPTPMGDDLYVSHPGLMTLEEQEDAEYVASYPPEVQALLLGKALEAPSPDAEGLQEFEKRPPALGFTASDLMVLECYAASDAITDVERRHVFRILRAQMLRQLISCRGCGSVRELVAVLRDELKAGTPATVPRWYSFSTTTMGPRRLGYKKCSSRGCLNTEDLQHKFLSCAACKVPYYCSPVCQRRDWKARHKHVCASGRDQREYMQNAGALLQRLSDMSLTGQDAVFGPGGAMMAVSSGDRSNIAASSCQAAVTAADTNPAVIARRAFLRAEKQRAKEVANPPEPPPPSPPSGDPLIDAVVRVRQNSQKELTAAQLHSHLVLEMEWQDVSLAAVKKASSKAAKLAARPR